MATASTARATGSLLGTLYQTANAATAVVSTVDNSISMLNDFVTRHRTMQADKNIVELANYRVRLIEDTAKDIADRRLEVLAFLEGNPARAAEYTRALNEMQALFAPKPNAA